MRAHLQLVVAAVAACCIGGAARAQSTTAETSFNPQLFHPAPGPGDFVTVESAQPLHHKAVAAGLAFNWARDPLSILTYSSRTGDPYGARVQAQQHVLGGELWVALGLWERAQIALSLPMTIFQTGQAYDATVPAPDGVHVRPPSGFALGDPRLYLKVRLYGRLRGPQLAISYWHSFPVGNEDAFGGEPHFRGFAGEPRLLGEWVAGRWRAGLSVGFAWRAQSSQYFSVGASQAITYAAAVAVDVLPRRLRLVAELYGHHDFGSATDFTAASPLELDVAARGFLGRGFSLLGGIGTGVVEGAGTPTPRVFLAFAWEQPTSDRDGDGIPDGLDRCPDVPEDRDGWEDEDGCPDVDDDGDGILDRADKCPHQAEDFDHFEDDDGCPEKDNDRDGIDDLHDACPNDPEDHQGARPNDGCPSSKTDQDGDGIPDSVDKCPADPEDKDGFEDDDGCPEPDNDEDGIPDGFDECPNAAEDFDQVDDEDGCPDAAGKVKLDKGDFKVAETIAADEKTISARGLVLLDVIGKQLKARTSLEGRQVRVEGFWDKRGDRAQPSSQAMAELAKKKLVELGVAADRIIAVGYGAVSGSRRIEVHLVAPSAAPATEKQDPEE